MFLVLDGETAWKKVGVSAENQSKQKIILPRRRLAQEEQVTGRPMALAGLDSLLKDCWDCGKGGWGGIKMHTGYVRESGCILEQEELAVGCCFPIVLKKKCHNFDTILHIK